MSSLESLSIDGGAKSLVEVVELGHLLLLHVHPKRGDAYAMEWRKSHPPLMWCPEFKCLYFSTKRPRRKSSNAASEVQLRCYRMWHDQDPSGARIDVFDADGEWETLGEVRRIDYHSMKWADDQEYTHDSRGGSYLYRLGQSFYAIKGKMRATARGLVK